MEFIDALCNSDVNFLILFLVTDSEQREKKLKIIIMRLLEARKICLS